MVTVTDKRGQGTRRPHQYDGSNPPPWFPVFVAFEQERLAQLAKWGDQNGRHSDGTGNQFFVNWADEYKRQNDALHEAGKPGVWSKILLEEIFEALSETDGFKLFHELKQAGAVITSWMEDLIHRGVVQVQPK